MFFWVLLRKHSELRRTAHFQLEARSHVLFCQKPVPWLNWVLVPGVGTRLSAGGLSCDQEVDV